MRQLPHVILELANFHGGDPRKVYSVIEQFSNLDFPNIGIKFQIFKFDEIALPDFSGYEEYKKLFIDEETWSKIINAASDKFTCIWIDIFDIYSIRVIKNIFDYVCGFKLQSSILDNMEIYNRLKEINISEKKLMINISGYELSRIEHFIKRFRQLNPAELILQIGFQDYPTNYLDTSLRKISILKEAFPEFRICYADHLDVNDSFAVRFPEFAYLMGCDLLEKHICIENSTTKYDAYSSLEFGEISVMIDDIKRAKKCLSVKFITPKEENYLLKSLQKPVARYKLYGRQLISEEDVCFKRTDQSGMTLGEIYDLQRRLFILKKDVKKNVTLDTSCYKKARIGVVVAVRMKSNRLKQKAILPIKGLSSIERCLGQCSKISNVSEVIMATSNLNEDAILSRYNYNDQIRFFQGDPIDVMKRYVNACRAYDIDVIVRVTGDCPVVSPEINEYMIRRHFETGADYSAPREHAVGTICEIYNREALERVIKLKGETEYSEYMTWYMFNNPHIFKINTVDLPKKYVRDYRLTLDFEEDLLMFNRLFEKMEELGLDNNIDSIFYVLDKYSDIAKINSHIKLRYKSDQKLIDMLNRVSYIELPEDYER